MSDLTPSVRDTFAYDTLLPLDSPVLNEPGSPYQTRAHWGERHLQCVWFNDKLRPAGLKTANDEPVEVLSPGRWNLEAGPDFLDAALLVGQEKRHLHGDVEIHIRPSGWTRHGHSGDPRYERVVLHLTYFPGPRPTDLPRHVLEMSLQKPLQATPAFSFDDIDLAAYPHALPPATPRPCQAVWGDDPDKAMTILTSAGHFRYERKRQGMLQHIARTATPEEALYEGIMTALGYKRNALAFRTLARAFPLSAWTPAAPALNYATLLGLGGLLPQDVEVLDPNGEWLGHLWRLWWRNPRPRPEEPIEWHLDATRPSNHPKRRLAAAASLFSRTAEWLPVINGTDLTSPDLAKDLGRILMRYSDWPEAHERLSRPGMAKTWKTALLGESAAAVVVNNALIPFLGACHPKEAYSMAQSLRPEPINATMRTMADRLFGRDHNPLALYGHSGLAQQGLLQIYSDFCLNSRNACRDCRFGHRIGIEPER